jgi:hypothetical protein
MSGFAGLATTRLVMRLRTLLVAMEGEFAASFRCLGGERVRLESSSNVMWDELDPPGVCMPL